MKNYTEPKHRMSDLEQLEAMELKRRAAEDAVKDADYYALKTRPEREKTSAAKQFDPVSHLLKTGKYNSMRVGSQEGIDGVFVRPDEAGNILVLSDEMLEISLADEVSALTEEPIRIFHVQSPTPWVEQVHAGEA